MPQVKITDPKTGVKYTLPEGVEPTADVVRRVIEAGRKADSDAVSESPRRGEQRLDDGRVMRWEATQETDGGAAARWERSGPKLSDDSSGLDEPLPTPEAVRLSVRSGVPGVAALGANTRRWRDSVAGLINGVATAPIEAGRLGLDYAKLALLGLRSGVDPIEAARRGSRLLTPFLDQLEAGGAAALEGGGLDLKRGGAAVRGSMSKLWQDDPAGLLAQAAPLVGAAGGLAVAGARGAAVRAMAPEVLAVPGAEGVGLRTYKKSAIEPITGRPLELRRPASSRGSAPVGSVGSNPPAWGMPDAAWYRLIKTVEDSARDSGLSTYKARGAATAYSDLLHGVEPNAAALVDLEGVVGAGAIGLLKAKTAGIRRVRGVKPSRSSARPGAATRGAIKDPGIDAADLSRWDGSALGDPSIDIANVDRIKAATATLADLMGVPKGLKAGFDLSAPGRQGAPLTAYMLLKNPKGYVGAWRDMFKSAEPGNFVGGRGEMNYEAATKAIQTHSDFGAARKSGLKFSLLDGNEAGHLAGVGDVAAGNAHQVPGPISAAVGKIPGLGMSERAYNAFLDRLRMEAFATMKKAAGPKAGARELADIADIVNVASGYGDPMASLNELQRVASGHAQNLEKLRGPLSSITSHGMFSARNTAARFQYLNPVRYARMSKAAQKIAVEQMVAHALGAGAVMGLAAGLGATVAGPNPKGEGVTGDFGKIKVGDTRYEVTGGYARQIRLTLALGQVAAGRGSEKKKLETMRDLLAQFFRNSASPVAGAALDSALPQYTPMGAPETASARALDMVMPLMAKEFYDAFTQKSGGGVRGVAQVSPTLLGVGVQKYESTIYSRRGKATGRGLDRALSGK